MIPQRTRSSPAVPTEALRRHLLDRQRFLPWQKTWAGGHDPLHLVPHCNTPLTSHEHPVTVVNDDSSEIPRAALLQDSYPGWYASLLNDPSLAASGPAGRSRQVDVLIRRKDWLGKYRQSRETGLWFRGAHRWHQLAYQ